MRWVPAQEGDGGPSRGLRRTVTALSVVFAVVIALSYVVNAGDRATRACVAQAPAGAEVAAEWRWWPPGHVCVVDHETIAT